MRTLSASEIERRGIVAVEEWLSQGPVHILKNGRTAYVAISARQFAQLTGGAIRQKAPFSAWEILLAPAAHGNASRRKVGAKLKAERDAWDRK
jgi:hypothetical protein